MNKNIHTQIGNISGAAVNIGSDHSSASSKYQVGSNTHPVDNAKEALLSYLRKGLTEDTAKMAEQMVDQATHESKENNKDRSKIKGILNFLEPVLKASVLVPEAIEAYDKWSKLLGV